MSDERERQRHEYRTINAWLDGEKSPAQRWSWRRTCVATLPPAVRAVGQQARLDGTVVVRLGILLVLMLLPVEDLLSPLGGGSDLASVFASAMPQIRWYGGLLGLGCMAVTALLALLCQGDA
jgi:hypothetical protein